MVVNANSTRLILTTAIPILEPRADENASVVMAAPDSLEHHAPVTISVRPVIIQIMMVSMNVPVILTRPCSVG